MPISELDKYKLMKRLHCRARTDYLQDVYNQPLYNSKLKSAIRIVKNFHKSSPFDAIAFCGYSGAAFAFPISFALNIPTICIRKREDSKNTHCDRFYEGILPKKYIIIDDRICGGYTIERIISEMTAEVALYNNDLKWRTGKFNPKNLLPDPELLAIFLYSNIDPYKTNYDKFPIIHIDYGQKEKTLISK